MHIHGNMLNVQNASFASISDGERSAAARRAAEVRKRLLNAAQSAGADATPEETLLISQWLGAHFTQVLPGDEYRAASGKNSDLV